MPRHWSLAAAVSKLASGGIAGCESRLQQLFHAYSVDHCHFAFSKAICTHSAQSILIIAHPGRGSTNDIDFTNSLSPNFQSPEVRASDHIASDIPRRQWACWVVRQERLVSKAGRYTKRFYF